MGDGIGQLDEAPLIEEKHESSMRLPSPPAASPAAWIASVKEEHRCQRRRDEKTGAASTLGYRDIGRGRSPVAVHVLRDHAEDLILAPDAAAAPQQPATS